MLPHGCNYTDGHCGDRLLTNWAYRDPLSFRKDNWVVL